MVDFFSNLALRPLLFTLFGLSSCFGYALFCFFLSLLWLFAHDKNSTNYLCEAGLKKERQRSIKGLDNCGRVGLIKMSQLQRLHEAAVEVICQRDEKIQMLQSKLKYLESQSREEHSHEAFQELRQSLKIKNQQIQFLSSQLQLVQDALAQFKNTILPPEIQSLSFHNHTIPSCPNEQYQQLLESKVHQLQQTVKYLQCKLQKAGMERGQQGPAADQESFKISKVDFGNSLERLVTQYQSCKSDFPSLSRRTDFSSCHHIKLQEQTDPLQTKRLPPHNRFILGLAAGTISSLALMLICRKLRS